MTRDACQDFTGPTVTVVIRGSQPRLYISLYILVIDTQQSFAVMNKMDTDEQTVVLPSSSTSTLSLSL